MLMSTATERLTRKDVPIEQTWDVSDLFPTYDDWTKELEAVQQDVINVTQYKGKLGDNAKTLLSALESYDTYLERIVRVGTYANLRISTEDRKSTRLNSSHVAISYAVFCLKSKNSL